MNSARKEQVCLQTVGDVGRANSPCARASNGVMCDCMCAGRRDGERVSGNRRNGYGHGCPNTRARGYSHVWTPICCLRESHTRIGERGCVKAGGNRECGSRGGPAGVVRVWLWAMYACIMPGMHTERGQRPLRPTFGAIVPIVLFESYRNTAVGMPDSGGVC